jgi:hypothetical protein
MRLQYQCFVAEPAPEPGSFTFERSDASSPLTITYHISGGPTDLNSDPTAGADHTATFASGASSVTVTVALAAGNDTRSADVTLIDGATYDVGAPSSAEVPAEVNDNLSCPRPTEVLTDIPTNHSQSIEVGGQPVALELNDGILDVAIVQGRLPNGLSLNPDGTWSGSADETGEFPITLCFADPVCAAHGPWEFTLTVLPRSEALPRTGAFTLELVAAGLVLILLGIALRRPVIARLR